MTVRYQLLKHIVAIPLLHAAFRIEVHGREHIPREGGVIVASNHISAIDSVFVPLVVPRHVTFLAKREFTAGRGLGAAVKRGFMSAMGQLAIERGGGAGSAAGLDSGVNALLSGRVVGIYPEGTRSVDGRLYRGRTGVARMVLASGAVVVPAAVFGTDEVLPVGRVFPRLGTRVTVAFGPPLDFSRYAGMLEDRFVLRSVTDEIMREIARLSGRQYVDAYAPSRRAAARAEAAGGDGAPAVASAGGEAGVDVG